MSRFISAGTSDDPPTERDEAWQKAQQELEVRQLQKAEAGKQQDGKTLYETLQANKGLTPCQVLARSDVKADGLG